MVLKTYLLVVQGQRSDDQPEVHVLPWATTHHQACAEAFQNHFDGLDEWTDEGDGVWTDGEGRWAHVVELSWDSN